MDKKSIGSFIAALRKAKGMTQKDLAGLLHVSDKTVSRWEVGEGTPDLALIPVLAEVFGVTCDELLRGERRADAGAAEITPLGEKRKQWLMDRAMTKLNVRLVIASAATLLGVFVTVLAALPIWAYHNALLIMLLSLPVYIVSAVLVIVSLVQAFGAVEGVEPRDETARFRSGAYVRSMAVFIITTSFTGVSIKLTYEMLKYSGVFFVDALLGFAGGVSAGVLIAVVAYKSLDSRYFEV